MKFSALFMPTIQKTVKPTASGGASWISASPRGSLMKSMRMPAATMIAAIAM